MSEKMSEMFKPTNDRVLCREEKEEEKMEGGIIVPAAVAATSRR